MRWVQIPERRRDALVLASLVLLSLVFYARAVSFGFIDHDDTRIVLGHPNLYDETSLGASLREIFVGHFPREEPLVVRDVTWAIDARLHGFDDPLGYHLGNVVLNALMVGLVFLLLRRWLRSRVLAGGASLAFALLPVHVEPVCWVMGRKDLLAALFMGLGLLAQSVELESGSVRRRTLARCASLLCCALALGSKISAVAFPIVLGLHRWFHPWLEGGGDPRAPMAWRPALRRTLPPLLPHAALTVAVFVWYRGVLLAYGVIGSAGPPALSAEHLGHMARFLPLIGAEYLRSVFAPGELSIYYRWPHVEIPLAVRHVVASALFAVGAAAALAWLLWRRRDLAFFALFSLALLLPYTGLFYVGFWRADRYVYLASLGWLVIAAVALQGAAIRAPRARPLVVGVAIAFVASSALHAWRQQEVWRSNESLWLHETGRREPALYAFQALAIEYTRRAAAASTPEARAAWLERAEDGIARGLARHDALGRVPGPYRVPEQLSLSRLVELRGRVAKLRGAPPLEQARWFRSAFELAPNRRAALMLSGSLYEAAARAPEPQRTRLVEESFRWFLEVVAASSNDPRRLAESRTLLESNYGGFPFLQARLDAARKAWFP